MNHIDKLASFLRRPDVDLYFQIHPNQVALPSFTPPSEWECWWEWSGAPFPELSTIGKWCTTKWQLLWLYYKRDSLPPWIPLELPFSTTPEAQEQIFQNIPVGIRELIDQARSLKLPRGKTQTLEN